MNSEQEQFQASLHSLLAASDVPAIARSWAEGSYDSGLALWRKLSDLGVTALAIPTEFDGIGATATDLVVALEELGHHAVPGPAIESVAVLPTLLAPSPPGPLANSQPSPSLEARASAELAAQWLPRLASGDTLATLPMPGTSWAVDTAVAVLPLGGTLGETVISIDPTRRLTAISGTAAVSAGMDMGALACAAQLLGCGQALLEQSVQYVQQRVQFGQSIGRFQAVKHHLADVRIALDFARPLVYHAAESLLPQDISAAKVAASEAANLAAKHGLQVHGAIGYTRECDLSLWLVKVRALIPAWGTPSWHRTRLMETL